MWWIDKEILAGSHNPSNRELSNAGKLGITTVISLLNERSSSGNSLLLCANLKVRFWSIARVVQGIHGRADTLLQLDTGILHSL